MRFILDSKDCQHLRLNPRKSLETPVILVYIDRCYEKAKDQILPCYYPREDMWSMFSGASPPNIEEAVCCHGKLYFISQQDSRLLRYDSFSNTWTSLPYKEQRRLRKIFVRNDDEIYSLVSEEKKSCPECVSLRSLGMHSSCGKRHLSFLTKYNPETNSWEDISSFDLKREGVCIVAKGSFIYFLGGVGPD